MTPASSSRRAGPPRLALASAAVAAGAALLLLGLDLRLPGAGAVALRVALIAAVLAGIGGVMAAAVRGARQARAGALEAQRLHADNARQLQAAAHSRDQVRASEQRLHELVDGIGSIVWEADPRTFEFTFVSQSAERLLGMPVRRWLEDAGFWGALIHPEDREAVLSRRREAVARGEDHRCEYRAVGADGRALWLEDIAHVVRDAAGNVFQLRGQMVDITERRKAQEDLRRNEARMRAVLDSALDAVVGMDDRGQVTAWNARAEEIFGWTKDEALGRKLAELIIPPALREEHARGLDRFLAGGDAPLLGRRVEMRALKRDGTEVPCELSIIAVRDGETWSFNAFLADISERKRNEEQLRHQLAFTSAITTHLGEGLCAVDREGRVTLMNMAAERMVGWRESELLGRPLHEVIHFQRADGTPIPVTECALLGVMQSGTSVRVEEDVFTRRNGSAFPVSYTSSPIVTDSQVVGAVLAFCDISDRREEEKRRVTLLAREQGARQDAESANRMKDEFLATLSHELRTPLNAIMGWAHLLRTGGLDEATAARALETIDRNAKAQNQLINDILDVSRIITGKLHLSVQPLDPAAVVEAALDTVRPGAAAKDVRIEPSLEPGAGTVSGDPDRLQQVVWNLLSNAIKFTPKGGTVQVRLRRLDRQAVIEVADSGAGISPEFLPHVFERFRQGDASTTRSHVGLGLGLAIVRHLVELHGGTVEARSDGEGKGSTFSVHLPLASTRRPEEPAGQAAAEPEPRRGDTQRLGGLRVLLLDDDPEGREAMTAVLENEGVQVMAVSSPDEALEAIRRECPDVLLSDIEMPGEDGHSFIRRVRELPADRGGDIPAAALTAYARGEDRQKALSAGFQVHVSKPVAPEELTAVIAELAGRRPVRPTA
jgi:PAS domain S-box-containing protein